jgi:hypothetical protein
LADWRKPKEQRLFDYVGMETWITKQFVCLINTYISPHFNLPLRYLLSEKLIAKIGRVKNL